MCSVLEHPAIDEFDHMRLWGEWDAWNDQRDQDDAGLRARRQEHEEGRLSAGEWAAYRAAYDQWRTHLEEGR